MSSVSAFIIFFMSGLHARRKGLVQSFPRKNWSGATISVWVMSSVCAFIIFFMSGLHAQKSLL
jgi:hypothetical protein